jgi:lycopene cyclase domain-containing protein
MATYILVNLGFIVLVMAIFRIMPGIPSKVILLTLVALIVLTAIFDSLIVGFDIVGYNPDKILGIYIIKAPIEDFFYSILAVLLVPTIWILLESKHESDS